MQARHTLLSLLCALPLAAPTLAQLSEGLPSEDAPIASAIAPAPIPPLLPARPPPSRPRWRGFALGQGAPRLAELRVHERRGRGRRRRVLIVGSRRYLLTNVQRERADDLASAAAEGAVPSLDAAPGAAAPVAWTGPTEPTLLGTMRADLVALATPPGRPLLPSPNPGPVPPGSEPYQPQDTLDPADAAPPAQPGGAAPPAPVGHLELQVWQHPRTPGRRSTRVLDGQVDLPQGSLQLVLRRARTPRVVGDPRVQGAAD